MTTLHETDFSAWLQSQMDCIRHRKFDQLDVQNLLEEMEDFTLYQIAELETRIVIILYWMLRDQKTPDEAYKTIIRTERIFLKRILERSPSMGKEFNIESLYEEARAMDSFPETCPWTINEVLGE